MQLLRCGHCDTENTVSACRKCGRFFVITQSRIQGERRRFESQPVEVLPDGSFETCDFCAAKAAGLQIHQVMNAALSQQTCARCHTQFLSQHGFGSRGNYDLSDYAQPTVPVAGRLPRPATGTGERVMTKYVARVKEVLRPGIHKWATIRDGRPVPVADMPLPNRVEIELDCGPDQPCMMYRYTDAGEFCGDTWHENLKSAFAQAAFKYGLSERDFVRIADDA